MESSGTRIARSDNMSSAVGPNTPSQKQVVLGFLMIVFAIVVGGIKLRHLLGHNNLGLNFATSWSLAIQSLGVVVSVVQLVAGLAWIFERKTTAMRWTLVYALIAIGHTFIVWYGGWHAPLLGIDLPGTAEAGINFADTAGQRVIMTAGVLSILWPMFLYACRQRWQRQTYLPVAFAQGFINFRA